MKKRRRIFGTLIILLLIALLACFLYFKYIAPLGEFENEIESLEKQISEQKEYSKELEKTEEQYSTDEYIEKHARSLGLVKPDEKIFRNYNDKK